MRGIRGVIRLVLFIVGSCIFVPWAWAMRECRGGNVDSAKLFHRMARYVFGIKVRIIGTPRENAATPTLFASNHLSYLDIIVLGSLLNARFVAKADVAGWPVFGSFAKTQRTIFIERTKAALEGAKDVIGGAIKDGFNIILFPEGTSTDGRSVIPFKAGLFDMFYHGDVDGMVQPVAIVIESVDGKSPDDQAVRDLYAWWRADDTLAPHLWKLAKTSGARLAVHFLPVIDPKTFADRKGLAAAATQSVADVLK